VLLEERRQAGAEKESRARANISRMGLTSKLLDQLADLIENKELSTGTRRAAVAGMINTEQRKIAAFLAKTAGIQQAADEIHLAHFAEAAQFEALCSPAAPLGKAGLTKVVENLFAAELARVDHELMKYRPREGKCGAPREALAYITKNHTSAHARGTAGVCVASDNPRGPDDEPEPNEMDWGAALEALHNHAALGEALPLPTGARDGRNQWDLPNFFQMTLFDAESERCEGALLLHYFEDQGRRLLNVSFQPTVSYLSKVDGQELFDAFMAQLAVFAEDNKIDLITCSTNSQMRTNRGGGVFEAALLSRITKNGRRFRLSADQPFSYHPPYTLDLLDVLWERKRSQSIQEPNQEKSGEKS
jgi:hypothetical protein